MPLNNNHACYFKCGGCGFNLENPLHVHGQNNICKSAKKNEIEKLAKKLDEYKKQLINYY